MTGVCPASVRNSSMNIWFDQVVFSQEDFESVRGPVRRRLSFRTAEGLAQGFPLVLVKQRVKKNVLPVPGFTDHPDAAAHEFRQIFGNCQPQACPAVLFGVASVKLAEFFEQVVDLVFGECRPRYR